MARMPGSPEFGIASLASVRLSHRCTTVVNGLTLHRYWTNARAACPDEVCLPDEGGLHDGQGAAGDAVGA